MVRSNTAAWKRASKERPDCQNKSVPAWTQGVNTFQTMWLGRGRTQPDDKNIYGLVPENVRSPASNLTVYDICHSSLTYIHALQVQRLRKPHIHTCTKTHRRRHVASESTRKQYFFTGECWKFCNFVWGFPILQSRTKKFLWSKSIEPAIQCTKKSGLRNAEVVDLRKIFAYENAQDCSLHV